MAYLHLIYIDFKNSFVYKIDTVIGIFSSVLSLYMYIFLWRALLGGEAADVAALREMVTYQAIGVLLVICYDMEVASLVGGKVMDGSISMDFIKPYSFALSMLCGSIGRTAGNFVKKGIPYLAMAFLITGFQLQIRLDMFPVFCVVVLGNMLLYWLIFFSIGLLHFILISAKWFRKIMGDLIKILGGSVVPIWYFPKQLAGIVLALPFGLLFQFPQSVLIGKLSMQEIRTNLLLLYVWVIVFALAAVILWRISVRFITIQGG